MTIAGGEDTGHVVIFCAMSRCVPRETNDRNGWNPMVCFALYFHMIVT